MAALTEFAIERHFLLAGAIIAVLLGCYMLWKLPR